MCRCFREVSFNLSFRRGFSNIYIIFWSDICKSIMQMLFFLSFLHTPIVCTISLPVLKTSPFRSTCTIPGAFEEGYSQLWAAVQIDRDISQSALRPPTLQTWHCHQALNNPPILLEGLVQGRRNIDTSYMVWIVN
jgi:hypothetical protein